MKQTKNKKSEARGQEPLPLNKSKGITTGFYIREENIILLENEQLKQERSLSWLVNNAIKETYGDY